MYGYGAQPLNWKGWTAVLVYVAVVMSFTVPLMILPTLSEPERAGGDVAIWLVLMVVVTLTFVRLCWVKTEGQWCWRWGQSE
jgi:NADH:ubiquinone oxidoreductase subunit 6 (subunit J)